MKRFWALKWARDLETTSAKQARGELNGGNRSYCCLGRACVVGGLRGVRYSKHGPVRYGDEQQILLLPNEIIALMGFKSNNPETPNGLKLSNLNDGGSTFAEIAKIIRENWESL